MHLLKSSIRKKSDLFGRPKRNQFLDTQFFHKNFMAPDEDLTWLNSRVNPFQTNSHETESKRRFTSTAINSDRLDGLVVLIPPTEGQNRKPRYRKNRFRNRWYLIFIIYITAKKRRNWKEPKNYIGWGNVFLLLLQPEPTDFWLIFELWILLILQLGYS